MVGSGGVKNSYFKIEPTVKVKVGGRFDPKHNPERLKVRAQYQQSTRAGGKSESLWKGRRFRRFLRGTLPIDTSIPIDPRLLFKHRRTIRQELGKGIRRAIGFQRVLERRSIR